MRTEEQLRAVREREILAKAEPLIRAEAFKEVAEWLEKQYHYNARMIVLDWNAPPERKDRYYVKIEDKHIEELRQGLAPEGR